MMFALLALLIAQPDDLVLQAIDGRQVRPFAGPRQATVVVFVTPQCPVSARYAPELNRLYARYRRRQIPVWLVYPGRGTDEAAIRAHHADHRLRAPALLDPALRLADYAGATVTPEAVVFDGKGVVVYRGRIDDRAVRPGLWNPSARVHDLEDVLNRISSGERVPPSTTQAVGCYIRPVF
jgi:hypothetical protein